MAILLIFEIPNRARVVFAWDLMWKPYLEKVMSPCSFCPRRNQKTYEQAKEMFSGFSAKTRTSVNGFPHADPAVRARTHPARTSVQRSFLRALNPENISLACSYVFWFRRGQNEQMTRDLLKIRFSHQILCKYNSRSTCMLGISNIKSIAIIHHTSCICITQ